MGRRSIVPVVVVALATCAWLHARAFSALVGGKLAVPGLSAIPEAQAAVAPPATHGTSADPILARNPFDSATGPLLGVSRTGQAPDARQGEETDGLEPCDDVRAVSIVTFADPEWSFAMLDVRGEPQPLLRRVGGIVTAIGPNRVLVARGARTCVARMFSPVVAGPPAPAVTRGIARTGPGSFALDRSARDALIEGAGNLPRSVMVRPEKVGDDVIGLRIAALKPGTALDSLGIRAGDVLESLDGIPLTAPDRMLEAYARARAEEHVRIVILRDGHEQQIDYEVR